MPRSDPRSKPGLPLVPIFHRPIADSAERRSRLARAFELLISIAERSTTEASRLDERITTPGGTRPDKPQESDHGK